MHQTRSEVIRALPLQRKGTKYVARAIRNSSNSVPLVIALRDMLKLARTSKEVKGMIHSKNIKINGKVAKNINDPIGLFSTLQADKSYKLTLLPTGRFEFVETKDNTRPLKIVGKRMVKGKVIQYGFHDGTTLTSKESYSVGDTLIVDHENKIKKHIGLVKGKEAFVFAGSNIGKTGNIESSDGQKVSIKFDKEEVVLNKAQIIAI